MKRALTLASVLLLAACGGSGQHSHPRSASAPSTTISVPSPSSSYPPYSDFVSPPPTTAFVAAPACTPEQLSVTISQGSSGLSQDVGRLVEIRNVSRSTCVLTGSPPTSAGLSSGASVTVPEGAGTGGNPPNAGRVAVAPEGLAYARVYVPSSCISGPLEGKLNTGPPYYTSLTVKVAGASRRLGGFALPAICGTIIVSPYYE